MAQCLGVQAMSVPEYSAFCRSQPNTARTLVRKACDSSLATSLSLGEQSPTVLSLQSAVSCPCGWVGKSLAAFHGHRWLAHNCLHPAQAYMDDSNQCPSCLLRFASRGHLQSHLTTGNEVCFLSMFLRMTPLDPVVVALARAKDMRRRNALVLAGLPKHHADVPPVRAFGPLWPLFNSDGPVCVDDNAHPFGPRNRKFQRADDCFDRV